MVEFLGRWKLERNGNYSLDEDDDGGGVHSMDKTSLPPSNKNLSLADWNLNHFPNTINQTNVPPIPEDGEATCIEKKKKDQSSLSRGISPVSSPTNVFGKSLHQKDLSYDDLSKNIDANLAEIDMETFRSEDINSILALPAIYSGNFQSASQGEQCASVSGSLLSGLELDASIGNHNSEDEISICKDEPLFSPQREPVAPESAISVDSLDNSSSYEQDLVLTCKANKNNYTIAFEGSETQFSDDSDYRNGCRSSEAESYSSGVILTSSQSSCCPHRTNSMVQSDLSFTTWSNIKHIPWRNKKKRDSSSIAAKSQSLPNLNHYPISVGDKVVLQLGSKNGNRHFVLGDVQGFQSNCLQAVRASVHSHSLSLLKLFMKHRVLCSSSNLYSRSNSSGSLIIHPFNSISKSLQNSLNLSETKAKDLIEVISNGNSDLHQKCQTYIGRDNLNETHQLHMIVDNIKILDWNLVQNITENNNNTVNSLYTVGDKVPSNNNNNHSEETVNVTNAECDNSHYFEDSLVDAPVLQLKNFHAMPIKEEEETDVSSADEIMRDSKIGSSNDNSSCNDAFIQNNATDFAMNAARPDGDHNLERINNIFPSCKSNVTFAPYTHSEEKIKSKEAENVLENQSQCTQTKQHNKNHPAVEGIAFATAGSNRMSNNQTSGETPRRYVTSRDSSPNSSGYVSSRHSSVERLQRSTHGVNTEAFSEETSVKKGSVLLTTMKSCSTQVPVHIKDVSMQTSLISSTESNVGFTLKDSSANITENEDKVDSSPKPECIKETLSATKINEKQDKCIYVCYPNYSLPDLSFLKSVGEDSGSVFLTPTKYKPPKEHLRKNCIRPKSCGRFNYCTENCFSGIKDWDSLNVLLPDNLKHLISQMREKQHRHGSVDANNVCTCKLHNSVFSPSESSAKDKIVSENLSHSHRGAIKVKKFKCIPKNSSNDLQSNDLPFASSSIPSSPSKQVIKNQCIYNIQQETFLKHKKKKDSEEFMSATPQNQNESNNTQCFANSNIIQNYSNPHLCASHIKDLRNVSNCAFCACSSLASHSINGNKIHSTNPTSDVTTKLKFLQMENKCDNWKGPTTCVDEDNPPSDPYTVQEGHSCQIQKECTNVKSQEQNNDMNSTQNYSIEAPCHTLKQKDQCCNCHSGSKGFCHAVDMCSDNNFDMDKPPNEFIVSPSPSSPVYATSPDSFVSNNLSSGGNRLFQEVLKKKSGLVENFRKATEIIVEQYKETYRKQNSVCFTSSLTGQKILAYLCPAVHTILSDGLLPSVRGFFGPLPNSPWKVAEASVLQGNIKKEVQDLLSSVNSEKLLTDSTYRFNAFIIGLLNLSCLEWWLGHLLSSQSLICQHYHPTALLSLLAHPATVHLQQELTELARPLSYLSFDLDLAYETRAATGDTLQKLRDHADKSVKMGGIPTDEYKSKKHLQTGHQFSQFKNQRFEPGMKINYNMNSPTLSDYSMLNIKNDRSDYQGHQVWPGITINPFPNAQIADEHNIHLKETSGYHKVNSNLKQCLDTEKADMQKEKTSDINMEKCKNIYQPHFSPCLEIYNNESCCASHAIEIPPLHSFEESEQNDLNVGDSRQFKKLQQKWEKITLGIEKTKKPGMHHEKNTTVHPNFQNHCKSRKKCTENVITPTENYPLIKPVTKSEVTKLRSSRAFSHSPVSRKNINNPSGSIRKTKVQGSDVTSHVKVSIDSESQGKKNKSFIPMLNKAGKTLQAKSKIPIQTSGVKKRSSN